MLCYLLFLSYLALSAPSLLASIIRSHLLTNLVVRTQAHNHHRPMYGTIRTYPMLTAKPFQSRSASPLGSLCCVKYADLAPDLHVTVVRPFVPIKRPPAAVPHAHDSSSISFSFSSRPASACA